MKRKTDPSDLMTRYLLGQLSEDEQLRLEEQFFTDEDSYEQLRAIEDELRYDYARGNLDRRQRDLFEKRFMATPVDRERVTLAKAVIQKTFETAALRQTVPAEKRSVWQAFSAFFAQPSFAPIAALLAVACGTGLLMEELRLRGRMDQMQAHQQRAQTAADAVNKELAQERSRRQQLEQEGSTPKRSGTPTFLSFVLAPGLTRDIEGPKRIVVPSGVDSVRLQLDLKSNDVRPAYRAALQTLDGAELWSQDVRSAASGVTLTVPARILAQGDYVVELKSDSARAGEYYFTVVK